MVEDVGPLRESAQKRMAGPSGDMSSTLGSRDLEARQADLENPKIVGREMMKPDDSAQGAEDGTRSKNKDAKVEKTDSSHAELPKERCGILDQVEYAERVMRYQQTRQKKVNKPVTILSFLAHINFHNPYLNTIWLVLVTLMVPAVLACLYFGLIPIDDPFGSKKDKYVWVFVVNPVAQAFLGYIMVTMFYGVLDSEYPWRPFRSYSTILFTIYCSQVLFPGLVILFDQPFEMLGLVSIVMTGLVAMLGLHFANQKRVNFDSYIYYKTFRQFRKVIIVFAFFMAVLMAYIVAYAKTDSWAQGLVTLALSVITFIFKKILLAITDPFPLEMAMAISGLWIENLVDIFIVLAYPTTNDPGATFAIIWVVRTVENVALLAFQTDAWFNFRVWIKGKFKKTEAKPIEADLNPDDRGHSNQHPGYRRRQLRFLIWKLISLASSSIFFLCIAPVLRYGWNKDIYPYQELTEAEMRSMYSFVRLDEILDPLDPDQFRNAMIFAATQLVSVAAGGVIVWRYMSYYVPQVLDDLFKAYQFLVVSDQYFGFILTILISNVLLGVMSMQTYTRVYWI